MTPEYFNKKLKAQQLAQKHIKTWLPCEVCGITENIHKHHDDYDKPLKVRFLCAKHHRQQHPSGTRASVAYTKKGRLKLKTVYGRAALKITTEDLIYIQSL